MSHQGLIVPRAVTVNSSRNSTLCRMPTEVKLIVAGNLGSLDDYYAMVATNSVWQDLLLRNRNDIMKNIVVSMTRFPESTY